MSEPRARTVLKPGATLIELIVVLAVLGLLASVVAPAISRRAVTDERQIAVTEISALRSRSLNYRTIQQREIKLKGRAYLVTVLPDGSILADSSLGIERFSGRSRHVGY